VKKWILAALIALLVLAPAVASGQVLIGMLLGDKVTSPTFHLGANVGANYTTLTGIDGAGGKWGFQLALFGEWKFAERWYLQPELVPFFYTGAHDVPTGTIGRVPPDEFAVETCTTSMNYFAVPIILKFAVAPQFHIGAGPQVGWVLKADNTYEAVPAGDIEVTTVQDIKDAVTSPDYGVAFHLEYKFKDHYLSPSVTGRYYYGLADVIKDNTGDEVRNSVFELLLSFPIGGDKDVKQE
jgi:hypothetical protein